MIKPTVSGFLLSMFLPLAHGCATAELAPDVLQTAPATRSESTVTSGDRAGMKAYKDPVTGEFTPPPPATQVPQAPETQRELNQLDAPLVERMLPDGGVAVNIRGRFRSYATATKDADGKVTIQCEPEDRLTKDPHSR